MDTGRVEDDEIETNRQNSRKKTQRYHTYRSAANYEHPVHSVCSELWVCTRLAILFTGGALSVLTKK